MTDRDKEMLLIRGLPGSGKTTMAKKYAQADADNYCEMVKAGHWPDYQGTYRTQCRRPSGGQR